MYAGAGAAWSSGDADAEASPGNVALSDVAKSYAEAMAAVEGARELVLGSFNVYATRPRSARTTR